MANKHENLTSLFTDIADAIREKTGGGGDTLTWDGNTEGLVTDSSGLSCKISDAAPTMDDFSNGAEIIMGDESVFITASDVVEVAEDYIGVGGIILIVGRDNYVFNGVTFPSKGIYIPPTGTTVSLTIPGYTGFSSKIIADNFPEAIAAIETCPDDALFLDEKESLLPTFSAYRLRYLNGAYYASGGNSNKSVIARSVDGLRWDDVTMPETAKWYDFAYGAGKIVAIAYNSAIAAVSSDGVNWTTVNMPSSQNWSSVAYGNDKFVAMSPSVAAYSTDGVSWTSVTLPSSQTWNSVTFGAGKFAAIGLPTASTSNVAYSTDGATWSTSPLPRAEYWSSVQYVNDKFLAFVGTFAGRNSQYAAYSADGVEWTEIVLPSKNCWGLACYCRGMYVAVKATNSVTSGSGLATLISSDGITWTYSLATYLGSYGMTKLTGMTTNGSEFVLANYGGEILYSKDRLTWDTKTYASVVDKNDVDVTEETIQATRMFESELATQDDLIAQIAVALEGKTGASGGSPDIPTCTVICQNYVGAVEYSKLVNGVITHIYDNSGSERNFSDVVCGTIFMFYNYGNDHMPDSIISGNAEIVTREDIDPDSACVVIVNGDCTISLI